MDFVTSSGPENKREALKKMAGVQYVLWHLVAKSIRSILDFSVEDLSATLAMVRM
jgi:hypothetical protein